MLILEDNTFFQTTLMDWSATHPRPMPWKGERDPYKIWLSEIILQQTRVEQGWPYYERFVGQYPTIDDLAKAPEDAVLKLWEGLGYYSRARNLHFTAKWITSQYGGVFPSDYEAIRALKGIGDYTAAAIASFGFDLPYAVLDGNVYRVLSRFFAIETPVDSNSAKKIFAALAQSLLDTTQPGAYNQAMMDFGATACTPQNPDCLRCPLNTACKAYQLGMVDVLPIKTKQLIKKERYFCYFVLRTNAGVYVQKRSAKDIWKGLWEFPLVEIEMKAFLDMDKKDATTWCNTHFKSDVLFQIAAISAVYKQTLTHRKINAVFCEINLSDDFEENVVFLHLDHPLHLASEGDLKNKFAFPRIIDQYLDNKSLSLSF